MYHGLNEKRKKKNILAGKAKSLEANAVIEQIQIEW